MTFTGLGRSIRGCSEGLEGGTRNCICVCLAWIATAAQVLQVWSPFMLLSSTQNMKHLRWNPTPTEVNGNFALSLVSLCLHYLVYGKTDPTSEEREGGKRRQRKALVQLCWWACAESRRTGWMCLTTGDWGMPRACWAEQRHGAELRG